MKTTTEGHDGTNLQSKHASNLFLILKKYSEKIK